MNNKYVTNLRPVRGTIYTLLALALALFGLLALAADKWSLDALPITAWCGVCAAALGWRAWANLTGDWDMAKTSKPAMAAMLVLILGGRLLQLLASMRLGFVDSRSWIYWVVAALALVGAVAVFRRVSKVVPKASPSTEASATRRRDLVAALPVYKRKDRHTGGLQGV